MQIFKRPDEQVLSSLDFSTIAAVGSSAAITLVSVKATSLLTQQDSTAEMIGASPVPAVSPNTQQVVLLVIGGNPGDRHRIDIDITANSQEFQGNIFVDVIAGL